MENKKIDLELLKTLPLSASFCVNTVEYGFDYIEITDYLAFDLKIPVIVPVNLGFGSLVLVFTRDSARFADIIQGQSPNMENILKSIVQSSGLALPSYLNNHQQEIFEEIKNKQYDPQIIPASNLTSAIVINIILGLLKNDKIKLAPQVIYLDGQEIIK